MTRSVVSTLKTVGWFCGLALIQVLWVYGVLLSGDQIGIVTIGVSGG